MITLYTETIKMSKMLGMTAEQFGIFKIALITGSNSPRSARFSVKKGGLFRKKPHLKFENINTPQGPLNSTVSIYAKYWLLSMDWQDNCDFGDFYAFYVCYVRDF